jgi:hypothetical protein
MCSGAMFTKYCTISEYFICKLQFKWMIWVVNKLLVRRTSPEIEKHQFKKNWTWRWGKSRFSLSRTVPSLRPCKRLFSFKLPLYLPWCFSPASWWPSPASCRCWFARLLWSLSVHSCRFLLSSSFFGLCDVGSREIRYRCESLRLHLVDWWTDELQLKQNSEISSWLLQKCILLT